MYKLGICEYPVFFPAGKVYCGDIYPGSARVCRVYSKVINFVYIS